MDSNHTAALHLSPTPLEHDRFPDFLRHEVETVALEIFEHRAAVSEPGDEVQDWLDAELEVLERCMDSPARELHGGEALFLVM